MCAATVYFLLAFHLQLLPTRHWNPALKVTWLWSLCVYLIAFFKNALVLFPGANCCNRFLGQKAPIPPSSVPSFTTTVYRLSFIHSLFSLKCPFSFSFKVLIRRLCNAVPFIYFPSLRATVAQPSTSPQLPLLTPPINNQLVSRALKSINHSINERESAQDVFSELNSCHLMPLGARMKWLLFLYLKNDKDW